MTKVEKLFKIIMFALLGGSDFIIGLNVMYCIDRPEVGLWRIPIMLVLIIGLNLFTLPLLIADNLVVEEGA